MTALDLDAELLDALRAARRRAARAGACAPTPARSSSPTRLRALPRADADDPAARRRGGPRGVPARARARTCAPAALLACAIVAERRALRLRRRTTSGPRRSMRASATCSTSAAPRACAVTPTRSGSSASAASLAAERRRAARAAASEHDVVELDRVERGAARSARPRAPGFAPQATRSIARDRRARRAARWCCLPCLTPARRCATLRVCALYPDLMNIYADRGNLLVLERRCAWRGIGFELHASGLGEPLDGERARPLLHRRRAGPRPAPVRRGPARAQARRRCTRPPRAARSCSASAAATSCSDTPTRSATRRSPGVGLLDVRTVREDGPRLIGNVAIEVTLDGARDGERGARGL